MSTGDAPDPNEKLTTIKFNLYSLKFTPYNDASYTNADILTKIITYVTNEIHKGKGHLIDRHHKRIGETPRELFISSAVIMPKDKRIRCTIALLRAGRVPMLKPADKFKLIPLDSTIGSIAEQTHFFIDYSKSQLVLCTEFNYHGPRASDIEYYFRNVGHETLRISKATELAMFMDSTIDKTLAELKNVLNIDIKLQPKKLVHLDSDLTGSYLTGINSFGNLLKPKYIKLEAMYQSPGNTVTSTEINKEANGMIKTMLKRFKGRPFNIEAFESFVVKYEDKDGQEEVFNLLKGKKELVREVDLKKITKLRQWYELIETEFNEFVDSI
ncbi:hypothetical protein [Pedobacter nutrimenti]|uniref:Uncharacterized protein n=1 Tax=Pedobacter nutrimenti TaxID=1241337 RepID=A0A318U8H5_9SPHI|nr:hypothetical protein [Pedobacter nutrimenti]PYF70580.1 hypothetical protein B0O44_1086 [Pedobacter nutrimenti]